MIKQNVSFYVHEHLQVFKPSDLIRSSNLNLLTQSENVCFITTVFMGFNIFIRAKWFKAKSVTYSGNILLNQKLQIGKDTHSDL